VLPEIAGPGKRNNFKNTYMIFKNLFVYYLFIVLPLFALVLGVKYKLYSSNGFVIGFVFYVFVYHPLVSGLRLLHKNKIKSSEFWRNFIPLWNTKYFTSLFFEK
jgi:hypothetical protein